MSCPGSLKDIQQTLPSWLLTRQHLFHNRRVRTRKEIRHNTIFDH
ncbi:MAG: hypothetical protein ACI831_001125, partial [Candidatus Azotimanducaceae bacterium]